MFSLDRLSKRMAVAGVEHVLVQATNTVTSTDSVIKQIEKLVHDVKEVRKQAKQVDLETGAAPVFQAKVAVARKTASDLSDALKDVEDPEVVTDKIKSLAGDIEYVARTLFPHPTQAQLTDARHKEYYNKVELFRVQGRQVAWKLKNAKTTEDSLYQVYDGLGSIAAHLDQLYHMASE